MYGAAFAASSPILWMNVYQFIALLFGWSVCWSQMDMNHSRNIVVERDGNIRAKIVVKLNGAIDFDLRLCQLSAFCSDNFFVIGSA